MKSSLKIALGVLFLASTGLAIADERDHRDDRDNRERPRVIVEPGWHHHHHHRYYQPAPRNGVSLSIGIGDRH